jgi:hypothetical protein
MVASSCPTLYTCPRLAASLSWKIWASILKGVFRPNASSQEGEEEEEEEEGPDLLISSTLEHCVIENMKTSPTKVID